MNLAVFGVQKLHALCEKSVAVAVPVENAAAAAEKTRFGVSLGVEAHKLEAVVRAVGRARSPTWKRSCR